MFHRSSSPAPSIAPSIASTVPTRPSMSSMDPSSPPTKPDSEGRQDGHGSASRRMSKGKIANDETFALGAGNSFGTFNPGWGWGSAMASAEDNNSGHATPSKSKKGKGVFSRVFKSGDSTLVSAVRSQSTDFPLLHSRSGSTEILHPNPVRASFDSISTVIRPKVSSRSQTPPISLSPSGIGKTHTSPPPPSSFKKPKKSRPVSLNLPLEPPLTTNNLSPETRAELLRKNRKLQQVLGAEFYGSGSSAVEEAFVAANSGGKSTGASGRLTKKRPNPLLKSKRSRSFSVSSPSSITSFGDLDSDSALSPWSAGPTSATGSFPFFGSSFVKVNLTSPSLASPPFSETISKTSRVPSFSHPGPGDNAESRTSLSDPNHSGSVSSELSQEPSLEARKKQPLITPSVVIDQVEALNDQLELPLAEDSPFHDRHTPRSIEKTSFLDLSSRAETEDEGTDSRGRKQLERKQALATGSRSTSTPPLSPLHTLHFSTSGLSHARSLSVSTTGTVSMSGFSPEPPLSPDEAAALERKKKRERLVKLHRFLGSHIPAGLVLGEQNAEDGLPPIGRNSIEDASGSGTEEGQGSGKPWGKLKGKVKANSSVPSSLNESGAQGSTQGAAEPMSEHDRVLNVKRRARLEKVFGEFPPQKLYLSRTGAERPLKLSIGDELNIDPIDNDDLSPGAELKSLEFLRHRHSIYSLSYLVEKDDRQSLQDLLSYVQGGDADSDEDEEIIFAMPEDVRDEDEDEELLNLPHRRFKRRNIIRRHSNDYDAFSSRNAPLPFDSAPFAPALTPRMALLRDGITPQSGSSSPSRGLPEAGSSTNQPPAQGFQQRRKRAAKLTRFFGTDYKSLFDEMLDSIENSVRDDQKRGSLSAEEVQELLVKLRKLKAKQNQILS